MFSAVLQQRCHLVRDTPAEQLVGYWGRGQERVLQWDYGGFMDKEQTATKEGDRKNCDIAWVVRCTPEYWPVGQPSPALSPASPCVTTLHCPQCPHVSQVCTVPTIPMSQLCAEPCGGHIPPLLQNCGAMEASQPTWLAQSKCHQPPRAAPSSRKTEDKPFVWSCCALPAPLGAR